MPLVPADTNECVDLSEETPIVTMNVSLVLSEITRSLPEAGSVDLGYEWLVALLSLAQVNVRALSAILILSPLENP